MIATELIAHCVGIASARQWGSTGTSDMDAEPTQRRKPVDKDGVEATSNYSHAGYDVYAVKYLICSAAKRCLVPGFLN